MIRSITLDRLLKFHNGAADQKLSLGGALKLSLEQDPVTPVLLDAHFEAVDRRVGIILKLIRECLQATTTNASEIIFSHDDLYDSGYDAVENDKAFNKNNSSIPSNVPHSFSVIMLQLAHIWCSAVLGIFQWNAATHNYTLNAVPLNWA